MKRSPVAAIMVLLVAGLTGAVLALDLANPRFLTRPAASRWDAGPADRAFPLALAQLVPPTDDLARQGLSFDPRFAQTALTYLASGRTAEVLKELIDSPAASFLLRHARQLDYDIPHATAGELVVELLKDSTASSPGTETCRQSLAYFSGPMLDDPHWVADILLYLPSEFRFAGTLFLTYGYDIGVALAPDASLNGKHRHFAGHPRELVYYAVHELHHVGFMSYQPPPRIDSLKTCAEVYRAAQYLTQLEGMAVWAAYGPRRSAGALDGEEDYIVLRDEARMRRDEKEYFEILDALKRRADAPADAAALGTIERLSQGERLWYRVGARMAARIEKARGRRALVDLIKEGPARFMETALTLRDEPVP